MRGRGGRSTDKISLVKNAGGHNLIFKRLEVDGAETLQLTPVKTLYLETRNIPIRFILMISEETSKLERWLEIVKSVK